MNTDLYNDYGKLLSICHNEDDFSLFLETLTIYIQSSEDIDLRKLTASLLKNNDEFRYDILDYFKEHHPFIFDNEFLKYFFDTSSIYNNNISLIYQYKNLNKYCPDDFANNDLNLLSYFEDDNIVSFLKNYTFALKGIWNINLFNFLKEKKCFIDEHYLFVHNNIKDYLLETNDIILDNDMKKFLPTNIQTEIKKLNLRDIYTLYEKPIDEIFSENLQRVKVIIESFLIHNNSGIIIADSKKANLNFLRNYPYWEKEIINNKPLTEIMLWNNSTYIKDFFDLCKLNQSPEEIIKLFNKNKYVKIIENLPEKLKIMTLLETKIDYSDKKTINRGINNIYDKEILLKILMEDTSKHFNLIFSSNLKDDDKNLIVNLFMMMNGEYKDKILNSSHFESILSSLSNLGLLEKIGSSFSNIEKGKFINNRLFNIYPEFFYGFDNENFREQNSTICKKAFEKESLSLLLKQSIKKDMSL